MESSGGKDYFEYGDYPDGITRVDWPIWPTPVFTRHYWIANPEARARLDRLSPDQRSEIERAITDFLLERLREV